MTTSKITDEQQSAVRYDRDDAGIVTLTLDDPQARANTMNERYALGMAAALDQLEADIAAEGVVGVVVASAKSTFFAGGDLARLQSVQPEDAATFFAEVESVKAQLRRLETCGRPVVAAINGTALGGGLEIALACHHRIAVDDPRIKIGLPEVTLGLLPGGGGVTRTVRMLGLTSALMDWLLQGQQRRPEQAMAKGLIDELVTTPEELLPAARAWVLAHADDEQAATQPWERSDYRMPGGTPSSPKLAAFLPAFAGTLRKQLKGADYPAPRAILSAAVEGASVDVDTASRIESRYLTSLVTGPTAKAMIQAFFYDLQSISSGGLRPADVPPTTATRVGVLGAGMMGAGIAHACATRGIEVVLKDVTLERAEGGKASAAALLDKRVARGRMSGEDRDAVLARITPTADAADLAACDVVIEAVFEDAELKARVFAEAEEHLPSTALLCSNTSTLPITSLAGGVTRPADLIGLHFFSPVDKMRLVEIIVGQETSEQALARAIDLVQQIGKVPIVVQDSRGFYTSRVFGTFVLEGAAMVAEGIDPMVIERAATSAGFPSGPLTLLDEVTLTLPQHIQAEAKAAAAERGESLPSLPGMEVIDAMVERGRAGRASGGGFYDYPAEGPKALWPGLRERWSTGREVPMRDLRDRFTAIMALETARCFEEGVITSSAAANIGSILGIGFPPMRGGAVQHMVGYEGGLPGFVARAHELAAAYGPRFEPTAWLVARAEDGTGFDG